MSGAMTAVGRTVSERLAKQAVGTRFDDHPTTVVERADARDVLARTVPDREDA